MRIHLIRHGEVENPDNLVYADLQGFTLSAAGRRQAAAVADRLRCLPLGAVVASPLDRAVATATPIAAGGGCLVEVDERLTEWHLSKRWAGTRWKALPEVFPGELEAYMDHPFDLTFSPEPLAAVAARVSAAVQEWSTDYYYADVAFVSHQDPIHAARRFLTNAGINDYHIDKPEHGSVSTLERSGNGWSLTDYWAPPQ